VLAAVVLTACQSAPPADASYEGLASRVSTLEGQMKSAQPTLKKVEAIESHFKTLSLELGRISKTYDHPFDMNAPEIPVAEKPVVVKSAPAVVVAPVIEEKPVEESALKKVEPKKDVVKKAAIPVGELAVTAVRIGEQAKGITRIVLDTTKPAEIHYDLDNAEGLLVIDVPNSGWVATEAQALKKSPMIKSFRATHDDAGAHMVVELKRTAKVVATARLNPSGNSGNRVYVDVAPAE
jgi:hypothetical protein